MRDDDGVQVTAGDWVYFSYGIPPIGVNAQLILRDGRLVGLCPGHHPPEFDLRDLRKFVGSWYKTTPPRSHTKETG